MEDAQRLLTLSDFSAEFGWNNDERRAILYVPAGDVQP
jgi:hypothetical protein